MEGRSCNDIKNRFCALKRLQKKDHARLQIADNSSNTFDSFWQQPFFNQFETNQQDTHSNIYHDDEYSSTTGSSKSLQSTSTIQSSSDDDMNSSYITNTSHNEMNIFKNESEIFHPFTASSDSDFCFNEDNTNHLNDHDGIDHNNDMITSSEYYEDLLNYFASDYMN